MFGSKCLEFLSTEYVWLCFNLIFKYALTFFFFGCRIIAANFALCCIQRQNGFSTKFSRILVFFSKCFSKKD